MQLMVYRGYRHVPYSMTMISHHPFLKHLQSSPFLLYWTPQWEKQFPIILQKVYGHGRWRKLKGKAYVKLPNGRVRRAELHWYETHGVGRKDIKIKHYLD